MKFLVLTINLVVEIQTMQEIALERRSRIRSQSEISSVETVDQLEYAEASVVCRKFSDLFLSILVLS